MTGRMSACPGGQVGPYEGWPGAFPVIPTGYDSGFVALQPQVQSATQVTFETLPLPNEMEAFLTIAGVQDCGYGTLRAVVNGREVQSSPGAFAHGDRVRFRFRLRFAPETNVVQLTFAEGLPDQGLPDLSRATYRLNGAIKGGRVWNHPLVRADITHPEWIAATRNNLGRVAKEYGIDILYVDDLELTRPAERTIFDALRKDLPGVVFAGAASAEPGYDVFRLTNTSDTGTTTQRYALRLERLCPAGPRAVYPPDVSGPLFRPLASPGGNRRRWLKRAARTQNRPDPAAAEHSIPEHVERVLAEGPRWGLFPAVCLNYRDYGLDERAKQIILNATQG